MTDRKGKRFFLKCDGNCVEALNCVPLYIAPQEYKNLSADFNILRFTVENYVENVERIVDFNRISMLNEKFTRGLYKRGVEWAVQYVKNQYNFLGENSKIPKLKNSGGLFSPR